MGPRTAKEGDKVTAKAGMYLRKHFPHCFSTPESCVVQAKSEGERGQWLCISCGKTFLNNFETSSHPASHKLAWRNFATGNLEVP